MAKNQFKTQGQIVLEFSLVSFFLGIPLVLGVCAFMVHKYLDNAATADSFLTARAELYGNPSRNCEVAGFWKKQTELYSVNKKCSCDGQVAIEVSYFPFLLKSNLSAASPFKFKREVDLRSGGN